MNSSDIPQLATCAVCGEEFEPKTVDDEFCEECRSEAAIDAMHYGE